MSRSPPAGCIRARSSSGCARRATSTSPGSRSSGTSPSSRTPCSRPSSRATPGPAQGEHGRARLPVPHREPQRRDRRHPAGLSRTTCSAVGIPLRRWRTSGGRGRCEFTLDPQVGLAAADNMLLFRTAVKQMCRRHGLHASFMAGPALAELLLERLAPAPVAARVATGDNAFATAPRTASRCQQGGRTSSAGILEHAAAASVFTTPTSTATSASSRTPSRPTGDLGATRTAAAMIRVIGGPGDPGTHLENRVGEPAANPYLYMASQIAAGLDGIDATPRPGRLPRGARTTSTGPRLPRSLIDSIAALKQTPCTASASATAFVDYMLMLKTSEMRPVPRARHRLGAARVLRGVLGP